MFFFLLFVAHFCLADQNLSASSKDPYLWLEELESEKTLGWVKEQNKETLDVFEGDPRYKKFKKQIEKILQAEDRIPYGFYTQSYLYNFWQDKKHVQGIWRRTTLRQYQKKKLQWDILLDIDYLGQTENESWVYQGSDCLFPKYNPCLITLSRGGKDASVVREFDANKKSFIEDGFSLKEAKSDVAWIDQDRLLVGTDFGGDSLTLSGYPRILKIWKRGTPLDQAQVLFEGQATDVSVRPAHFFRRDEDILLIYRHLSFYETEYWLVGKDLVTKKLPLPLDSEIKGLFKGRLLISLRSDWEVSSQKFNTGSLLAFLLKDLQGSETPKITLLYQPDEKSSIRAVATTENFVLINILSNVKGKILQMALTQNDQWFARELELPPNGTTTIISADDYSDIFFINFENFLTPPSLYLFSPELKNPQVIKSLSPRFNAHGFIIEQNETPSRDGTLIPYFTIHAKNWQLDGLNPTLLYGYGGFEYSLTPWYSAVVGKIWLGASGIYVVANIRGGGEFGPRWHQGALKEKRQNAFDDFLSVAEDLIKKQVTSPKHLGIMGGSNGGLLVGASFTQKPRLFNAVVAQVPLLDMLRFTKLPPGASWIAEYGDPDSEEARSYLSQYSPYHQVKEGEHYPKVFFLTSTKDDRVHPGHARKMVAKMKDLGHHPYYYENIEGGHSAAANLLQRAKRHALEFVYFFRQLSDDHE